MQGLTLVPEDELVRSYRAAVALMEPELALPGAAYLEFGVFIGTTMACMYRASSESGAVVRMVGFDSFQGMPKGVETQDDGRWREGDLSMSIDLARENLAKNGVPADRAELVPGWFEDTLTDATRRALGLQAAPIVMVDCVIASATATALTFLTPLIGTRSLVYFDDWAVVDLHDRGLGERAAFEAWLAEHPEFTAEEQPALGYSNDARAFLIIRRPT